MQARKILVLGAVVCLTGCLSSCKGRSADATPNGETVEVDIDNVEINDTETLDVPDTMTVVADTPTTADTDTVPARTAPVR